VDRKEKGVRYLAGAKRVLGCARFWQWGSAVIDLDAGNTGCYLGGDMVVVCHE